MLRKIKNYFHLLKAILANVIYGFPSKNLKVIGVTGTDGKTTTASLIYQILKSAHRKVAMITTVAAYIGDKQFDTGFHVTTPSSFALQKYIKKAKDWGAEYLILETTSHALDQNRVWGIKYSVGVLTNITHEHLDYHLTYENYLNTKLRMLKNSKIVVLNKDDQSFDILLPQLLDKKVITYSVKGTADIRSMQADFTPQKYNFKTKLIGDYNLSNVQAAIAAVKQFMIRDSEIEDGLAEFTPPPGRMEIIYQKDFTVIVDFAHTPNSFAALLPSLKKIAKGKLIHLFGCAGARDSSKRPLMGRAAAIFDDVIILTSEDPRNENVVEINRMIKEGIGKDFKLQNLYEIADRKEAIKKALSLAQKGDVVVLTGKGHEKSINLGKGEQPWDDVEATKDLLKQMGKV